MSNKKQTYIGIMDAHGLESLTGKTKESAVFLSMRADCNRQRHATYFEIEVEPLVAANIVDTCQNGDAEAACRMVQTQPTLKVPDYMAKSVDMIPNPDLDPWH